MRLAIALGGAAGAIARHGVSTVAAAWGLTWWPWGTLAVNISGSWALGLMMWMLPATTVTPAVRAALTIGFCGGFTTFSTFSLEAVTLAQNGPLWQAASYVALTVLLAIAGVVAGAETGRLLTERRRRL